MKIRLSSFFGVGRKGTIRALLALDIAVGLLGLGIGMGSEVEAVARPGNFHVVVQVVSTQRPSEALSDGTTLLSGSVHLSAAEFAAALRGGDATFGTWNPEMKAFVVEPEGARPKTI